MCNYYEIPDPASFEKGFRPLTRQLGLFKQGVGPFDQGVFLRPSPDGALEPVVGQWGMIRPSANRRFEVKVRPGRKRPEPMLTNNCRLDSIIPPEGGRRKPTFAPAWLNGQRCLVPMDMYQEPNWETGKNIWWRLRRSDREAWAIAGLWSEWTDPETGELVPNYTCITVNCDHHPLLNRLHKPDPKLPPDQQDKRSLVHLHQKDWNTWLHGTLEEAAALLVPAPVEMFDPTEAQKTDKVLEAQQRGALVLPEATPQSSLFEDAGNPDADEQ